MINPICCGWADATGTQIRSRLSRSRPLGWGRPGPTPVVVTVLVVHGLISLSLPTRRRTVQLWARTPADQRHARHRRAAWCSGSTTCDADTTYLATHLVPSTPRYDRQLLSSPTRAAAAAGMSFIGAIAGRPPSIITARDGPWPVPTGSVHSATRSATSTHCRRPPLLADLAITSRGESSRHLPGKPDLRLLARSRRFPGRQLQRGDIFYSTRNPGWASFTASGSSHWRDTRTKTSRHRAGPRIPARTRSLIRALRTDKNHPRQTARLAQGANPNATTIQGLD